MRGAAAGEPGASPKLAHSLTNWHIAARRPAARADELRRGWQDRQQRNCVTGRSQRIASRFIWSAPSVLHKTPDVNRPAARENARSSTTRPGRQRGHRHHEVM